PHACLANCRIRSSPDGTSSSRATAFESCDLLRRQSPNRVASEFEPPGCRVSAETFALAQLPLRHAGMRPEGGAGMSSVELATPSRQLRVHVRNPARDDLPAPLRRHPSTSIVPQF